MNIILTALAVAGTSGALVAMGGPECSSKRSGSYSGEHANSSARMDIVDTALSAGSFGTLAAALTEAELVGALKGKGPFTVFAPTDEAFAKLPKGTVEHLLRPENRDQLVNILTYHVVSGEFEASEVLERDGFGMLNGRRATIDSEKGKIGSASIVKTDIECSNGVIHVIDEVILPSSETLLETAVGAGSFKTLAAAIDAAGLTDALNGDGPLTVFAPTDEAFAKLPKGTVESLLRPENLEKLKSILLYHVVDGRVYSDQAVQAGMPTTLEGSKLDISSSRNGVAVNGAHVVTADLDTSNGVIHVIDTVLLP